MDTNGITVFGTRILDEEVFEVKICTEQMELSDFVLSEMFNENQNVWGWFFLCGAFYLFIYFFDRSWYNVEGLIYRTW